ncbi:MAG: hypothetical protein ACP5HT_07745 [Conexivisphaera sp.]
MGPGDTYGIVACPMGHKLHSDLNGALNILRRGSGILVEGDLRPLSFIVDHNGAVPRRRTGTT